MLNNSYQLPTHKEASSARRSSSSPSSLLSSVINFSYSTDINTPPCLQSSDEDDIDDNFFSALTRSTEKFVPGFAANTGVKPALNLVVAQHTIISAKTDHSKVSLENQLDPDFIASMPESATHANRRSSSGMLPGHASFIPRPVYQPQQQNGKLVISANTFNDSASRREIKHPALKIEEVDENRNAIAVSSNNEHSSGIPLVSAGAVQRKKYESFLMTGNRIVNKTPQLQFLPHNASAPGLVLQSGEVASHHQDFEPTNGEIQTASDLPSATAAARRGDSPHLVDSAIPTATTTSSFNDDEESTHSHQRHLARANIGFRASLLREPSSNSSSGGVADNKKDAERNTELLQSTEVTAPTTDDESGIDLPKSAWAANDSTAVSSKTKTSHNVRAASSLGIENQCTVQTVIISQAEPVLSFFVDTEKTNLLHETDIVDAEPTMLKEIGDVNNKSNQSNESVNNKHQQQQNSSSPFDDFIVNESSNLQKSTAKPASASATRHPLIANKSSELAEWSNVDGPLPDILSNCRRNQHDQQQTSPTLGWSNDIEGVAGDTIAIIGSENCGFLTARRQQQPEMRVMCVGDAAVVQQQQYVEEMVLVNKSPHVVEELPRAKRSTGGLIRERKRSQEDRPVWTFNAPLQNDNVNNLSLEHRQISSITPAPTGYGATTRSVPASPATYRRGVVASGGSLSSGGGKRIGRALMMRAGGGDADSSFNNNYICSRPHQFVTVMPFLRLKSADSNGLATPQPTNGVTPSSNDTTLKSLARSLYYLKGCTPVEVADHIVEDAELKDVYLNLHNFSGLNLETALRQFLEKVCLVGTPQQKADLLERFARRFYYTYDEEFENWLYRSEMAKINDDAARMKLRFATLSSLPAESSITGGGGDDTSLSFSAYSTTDRQPSNTSTNKLFLSIRTTFFASLALVIVSSYFYQQQLASSSGSCSNPAVNNAENGDEADTQDPNADKLENTDSVNDMTYQAPHVRERHAAGSRHPKPGCLDHLPSISAYTVRYDEDEDEPLNNVRGQQKPMRKTSTTKSIASVEKSISVVFKAKNASNLTSSDANRLWNALFNDLLPADERVPVREQTRLRTSVCKEPMPVKLNEDEVEFLYQLTCRYEPHAENEADSSSFLTPAANNAEVSVAKSSDVPLLLEANGEDALMSDLLRLSAEVENEQKRDAVDDNLFVRRVTATSPPAISTATVSMPIYWPPFNLFMYKAIGDVMKIKHSCGPRAAHIKWWGRRWHRRLIELRDLILIERRPSLGRRGISDPKRQRADSEDVVIPLHHAWVERPTMETYPKHADNPNVLQLFLHSGAVRMLRCDSEQQAQRWMRMINLNCAFSAPVKVPATNDPTCLSQHATSFGGTLASSARSDIGLYTDTVGGRSLTGGKKSTAAAVKSATPAAPLLNYTPPRFFPDAITTFNQHQQLAELRDYAARCEHDVRVVSDEERELRQTRTLSLHASLRRSARRHTQRLLQQRSGALLLRKQLLATEVRRTNVHMHALEQLIGGSGDCSNEVGGNAAAATAAGSVIASKVVESVTVVRQSIKGEK